MGLLVLASAMALWAPNARADDRRDLSRLLACAEIENPPQRYACFDDTVAEIQGARTNTPLLMDNPNLSGSLPPIASSDSLAPQFEEGLDPRDVPTISPREANQRSFGMADPQRSNRTEEEFGLPADKDDPEVVTEIDATVSDFRVSGTGLILVLLDNGQVWQQVSGDSTRISEQLMRRQEKAKVASAAFGSYLMTLSPSNRAIRVRRIR
ncbi:MAG: hypothetical protein WBF53_01805 [Litorimonas sp.]